PALARGKWIAWGHIVIQGIVSSLCPTFAAFLKVLFGIGNFKFVRVGTVPSCSFACFTITIKEYIKGLEGVNSCILKLRPRMEVTREVRGLVLLAVVLMISPCSVDGMDGFERDNGVPGWSNASSSNMVSSENHAFIDNVQEKGTNFSQEIFVQSNGNVHSGGKGEDTGGGGGGGGGNGGGGSGNSN
ncbi:hypothetical protein Gotur_013045, partial [Gossypium turneri]